MATTTKTEEQILIGDGDQVIELTGEAKKEFLAQRKLKQETRTLLETEYAAKQEARTSALTKLAEIAGLNEEEMAALGL